MSENIQNKKINASPTKEFFIYMLTRDAPLIRSIIDLVDNSVDGARRINEVKNFNELWIRIEIDQNKFKISDNCGGISVDIARNYAFRFGRPPDAPPSDASIGQFGVGMKRTFFKVGKKYYVKSTTDSSYFIIDIDLDEWLKEKNENANSWHFEFSELKEEIDNSSKDKGTIIEITDIHPSVSESFGLDTFIKRLSDEISNAHLLNLNNGISITLNAIPIGYEPMKFIQSDDLKSVHREITYDKEKNPVKVKIYAGLSRREKEDGGWYIFCNGRMVVRADQTNLTVWGEEGTPKYHPDFAYFRGMVYFDSDDSSLLPWTTTKTGIDSDNEYYRSIKREMIIITQPFTKFLRRRAEEKKQFDNDEIEDNPLNALIDNAKEEVLIENSKTTDTFIFPDIIKPKIPRIRFQTIQYKKTIDLAQKVKDHLHACTWKEVGENTFDYFVTYEGLDDE